MCERLDRAHDLGHAADPDDGAIDRLGHRRREERRSTSDSAATASRELVLGRGLQHALGRLLMLATTVMMSARARSG